MIISTLNYICRDSSAVHFKCKPGRLLEYPYPTDVDKLECERGYYTARDPTTGKFLPPKRRQTYRCVDKCVRMCKPNGKCNKKTKTCNCKEGYEGNTCSRICPNPMSDIEYATSTPG